MSSTENNSIIKSKEPINRIYYLDILRVIACLAVVIIHASAGYVVKDFGSFNFWAGNIFDGLSRIGVPLFIMISGALMLDKNYNYSTKKIIRHIGKMIIFFIFWSGIYSCIYQILYPIIIEHKSVDILGFIDCFIKGYYHLWFIYMIIGLYLILPLLRLWVKNENKKYVEYFIILSIVFSFSIPQIISIGSNFSNLFEYMNNIIENINLQYVGGYTTYFILGWYLHNYDFKRKKIIYILGVFSTILTIVGTSILSISTGKAIQMYGNLTLNVLFQALMVFVFIKTKFYNKKTEKNKFVYAISNNSLGIYAMHSFIISVMNIILLKFGFNIAIINIPIIFIISFIIAFLGAFIFSKIPILKKIV